MAGLSYASCEKCVMYFCRLAVSHAVYIPYNLSKLTLCRIEKLIREDLAKGDHERIAKVVKQLCKDYAYDVHHPYARTGGLIGLAAASIALGSVRNTRASETSRKSC